ncbi:hypothetical protein A2311_03675 [candidate division WOR-1 bacterium RIFOXYB2_FULL_48_7]|uniref:Ion-translocating oxidoreductase complex subunit D n=1 Tax=candidate division WOR-1 bacterium RIFOXYB2_FULL_48_7 TaxID=1802583 RepID=A0A1F4TSI0_UNCSA|nr:MAG: hypothetical protein A2311_03675 [candidate division WOR-1 bacterium RIFOXYB2_FULL_48_7]
MKLFNISSGPHVRAAEDATMIMWWVVIALLFPTVGGIYYFGWPAAWLVATVTLSAVIGEMVFQWLAKRPVTIVDGSAVVTGLLLALILPPTLPLPMGVIGAIAAVVLVKGLFGGLGYNIFNPALAARAILLASWPVAMTTWVKPFETVTTATPLYLAKIGQATPGYWELFLGNRAGSLGETSILLLLIGAVILFVKKIIDWPAPAAYIGTVFIAAYCLGHDPLFNVLSGGLILGAFFMATDYVTVPVTTKGRFIFGLGCGVITVLIRFYGGFPEGVNYSILFMNMWTPFIDVHVRPRVLGCKK